MKSKILFLAMILFAFGAAQLHAADDAKGVSKSAKKKGWIGVAIQDVTPKLAREKKLQVKEGAYINDVVDDSPADSAGLKDGDVVSEFNSKKIEVAEDLSDAVQELKPGTKAPVIIQREGEKKTLSVTVGKNKMRGPFGVAMPHPPNVMIHKMLGLEGMELMELNSQLGEYFQAPNNKGVLVKKVEKNSGAEKAGIKAGDVITKIGKETIADIDDIHEAMEDLDEGTKVDIETIRKGKSAKFSLELTEDHDRSRMWEWGDGENFQFRIEPNMLEEMRELPNIQKNIQMQLRHLPDIQNNLKRIQIRTSSCEI
ncbi:MAG: PDZ domain-containing protein [Bacteroidota bacterium]|nr:PDZ domain-containing protein [Bacteroidota bacterium]